MSAQLVARLELDVRGIPELIQDVRRECAQVLRDDAAEEANQAVARRLREVAAAFEAGQSRGGD